MRDPGSFAALILSHGRPGKVHTMKALRESGYTGRAIIVVDDEDPTADEYRERFGAENVVQFGKLEAAASIDAGDLSPERRTIVYARNAAWGIARDLGLDYFVQLDDDYTRFLYRRQAKSWRIRSLDRVWRALIEMMEDTGALAVAMAQGGDLIGGANAHIIRDGYKRKVMNSIVCRTDRPFPFLGRINEDVTTYCLLGSRGELFLTPPHVYLLQPQTQQSSGGMTEAYLSTGTYLKSFYTVMMCPSFVRIDSIGLGDRRLHHHIDWGHAVPKILDPALRRADP